MKLKCGIFLDRNLETSVDSWNDMMIGAHIYMRKWERENAETARYEYYYKDGNTTYIVKNPTLSEKTLAYATKSSSNKVVGYRNESKKVANTKELKEILSKKNEEEGLEL